MAKNKLDKVKSELEEDLPAQDSELGPVLPADLKDITEPSAPTGVSEKVPEIPNLRPTTSPVSEHRSLIGGGDVYSVDQISANFEFEECETNRDFRVGTLRENIQFWSDILQANEFILETIREGYKIPFISLPDSYCIPNRGSTFTYKEFVFDAIEELIRHGCVIELESMPEFCNPLHLAVQGNRKLMLILGLSYLNKFVWKQSVKYEDIRTLLQLFEKNVYFFTFDLKSGYHHVEIFSEHQRFLAFTWSLHGVTKYLAFTSLPFGLTLAPFIFTKLMRSFISYWRGQGKRIVVYLDDGIGGAFNQDAASKFSCQCRSDLLSAGFFTNEDKSNWVPSQQGSWIGFLLNVQSATIQIPERKIHKLKNHLNLAVEANQVSVRQISSIACPVNSMFLAIGNTVRLFTRAMYAQVEARKSWQEFVLINEDVKREFQFWISQVDSLNGRAMWFGSSAV